MLKNSAQICRFQLYLMLLLSVPLLGSESRADVGIIQIETQTTVMTEGELLYVTVTVTNKGPVTAHNIQVHLLAANEKHDDSIKPLLEPGQVYSATFEKIYQGNSKGSASLDHSSRFPRRQPIPFFGVIRNDVLL